MVSKIHQLNQCKKCLQRHAQTIWLVSMIMLSWITKIKLELMAYEAMFATPISVRTTQLQWLTFRCSGRSTILIHWIQLILILTLLRESLMSKLFLS
jgi:hypothetical protein